MAALALVHGASAAELDPEVLRGSTAPIYPVLEAAPFPEDAPLYPAPAATDPRSVLIDPRPFPSWTGVYIGAHIGAGLSSTDFSDPFGGSVFGDTVRSPGFLGGLQAGFNWQPAGLPWVVGIEAAGDLLTSNGTNTCAAFSGFYVTSNCRANPYAFATATARIGHTFGPADRTFVYLKGGLAWLHTDLTSTTNNLFFILPQPASNLLAASSGGWTVGAGVEQALTPAWSVKLEYGYMNFNNVSSITTSSSWFFNPGTSFLAPVPAATGTVKENLQIFQLGLNYHFGQDPWAPGWGAAIPLPSYPVKALPVATAWAPGWEYELGLRYWYSSGRFQKDLPAGPSNDQSLVSRLTYADLTANAGEIFSRVDSPWGLFAKGMIGGGALTSNGRMNDEDWGIFGAVSYSNTLSQPVTGPLFYAIADVGFDALRGPNYKIGPFIGYSYLNEKMNAYGCTQIANAFSDCIPTVPNSTLTIVEDDTWQSLRIGTSAETMLMDRLKISGEIAYLPYVKFTGTDDHELRNLFIVENGTGRGVQTELLLSYMVTNEWSIGAGARYWAMWTTSGADAAAGLVSPRNDTYRTERFGVLLQTSYYFGPEFF